MTKVTTANSLALLEMINGSWKAQTIRVAAELGLADLLADGALVELTRLTADLVVQNYDFSGGGPDRRCRRGYGQLLATILKTHPSAHGVLFDLPHAIEGARNHFAELGLADACEFVAGDFFQSVPAGGDVYLLKTVIHDWNDQDSVRILRNCGTAMTPGARLLLVEQVLPDPMEVTPAHQSVARSDLNMLVALAAQERTQAQLRAILNSAGFRVERTIPTGPTFSIIEALAAH